jgi:hypothetical protein
MQSLRSQDTQPHSGVPVLAARVPCSVCGARQVYRPSEVFFGSLPQVWKGEALR